MTPDLIIAVMYEELDSALDSIPLDTVSIKKILGTAKDHLERNGWVYNDTLRVWVRE